MKRLASIAAMLLSLLFCTVAFSQAITGIVNAQKAISTKTPGATPTTIDLAANCDPSYPDICIPPAPPDLDCSDVSYRGFRVLQPDPHRFDTNKDGIGCPLANASSTPEATATPVPEVEKFQVTQSVVRIGYFSQYGFDFENYTQSALTKVNEEIADYVDGTVLQVPFKDSAEVELHYQDLDIEPEGILWGGSYFEVIPDPDKSKNTAALRLGKVKSWMIQGNVAKAYIAPWVYAPYGDGGIVSLLLHIETKQGNQHEYTWTFKVGENKK